VQTMFLSLSLDRIFLQVFILNACMFASKL
jgi:hypothetical protein